MAPSEPSIGSEKISLVPNASVILRRAHDTLPGITSVTGKPSAPPISEYATPVLPLVESMIVCPGVSRPVRIASRIIW